LLQRRQAVVSFDHAIVGTPVVLQEIETPIAKLFGVLRLVLVTAAEPTTRQRARGSVNARLEAFGMDIIREGVHVRKISVRQDISLSIPQRPHPPGIMMGWRVHP